MRVWKLMMAVMLVVAWGGTTGQAQGTPVDRDVRQVKGVDATYTYLTLVPANAKGPLPFNLSIQAVHRTGSRGDLPDELAIEFAMGRFTGQFDYTPPHYLIVLDEKSAEPQTFSASVEATAAMRAVNRFIIAINMASLRRMAAARTARGRILGVEFELSAAQLRAVAAFAAQVARRPR